LFICSEIMLFGALFAAFFYVHNQADVWPPEGVEKVPVALAAFLTFVLLSSSVAAHLGLIGIKEGRPDQFRTGILIAILLGSIFIAGQIYEWFNLFSDGITAKSKVYGSTFFVTTGFHGAHVIAGLCMLVVVLGRAFQNDFTPRRHL